MNRTLTCVIAAALLLSACGGSGQSGDGGTPTSTTTTSTTATTDGEETRLLLRIDEEGGFVPVEFSLNRIPRFTLYTDGSLYYQGPIPEIFPGPALPNIQIANIGAAGIEDVLEVVELMGLASIVEEINDDAATNVADATTTISTFFDDDGAHRYGVYALGFVDIAEPNVRNLLNLINVLDTYAGQSPSTAYVAQRMQLLVGESIGSDPEFGSVEAWAFEFDPTNLTPAVLDLACNVVEGDQTAAAYDTFAAANQATVWETDDGKAWRVLPRPLLPDEEGCLFGS